MQPRTRASRSTTTASGARPDWLQWRATQRLVDLAQDRQAQLHDQAIIGLAVAALDDLAEARRLQAGDDGLAGTVVEALLAERRPFGALNDDAQSRLMHHVGRMRLGLGLQQDQAVRLRAVRAITRQAGDVLLHQDLDIIQTGQASFPALPPHAAWRTRQDRARIEQVLGYRSPLRLG